MRASDSAGSRKALTPQSPQLPRTSRAASVYGIENFAPSEPDRVPVAHRGPEGRRRDADRKDLLRGHGRRGEKLLDRLDGRMVVAAARLALEVVAGDLEALPEAVQDRGRIQPGAADPAEDLVEHVGERRDTRDGQIDGEPAIGAGDARVGVPHGRAAESGPPRRPERQARGDAECPRRDLRVQLAQPGDGRGGAHGPVNPVHVHPGPDRCPAAQARGHVVAHDQRRDEGRARSPEPLGFRQRGRQHVDPGMAARKPVPLVQFQHRAGETVGHDRPPGLDARKAGPQHGSRPDGPVRAAMEPADLRLMAPAEDRADGVGQDQRRVLAHSVRERALGGHGDEAGERGQHGFHRGLGGVVDQRGAAWKRRGSRPANGFRPGGQASRGFS